MKNVFTLLAALCLCGCLYTPDKMRVLPENRQFNPKTGLVVLLPPQPHVHYLAERVQDAVQAPLIVPGFDGEKLIVDFMTKRLKGKALEVVAVSTDEKEFAAAYDDAWSFPRPERIREQLIAWGAAHNVGIVVVVYRQAHKDFVYGSINNLFGYGLVGQWQGKPHAFAAVQVEALEVDIKSRIGNAESYRANPLPPAVWRDEFNTATGPVAIPAADAPAVKDAVTKALTDAVQNAAQEAGLSH